MRNKILKVLNKAYAIMMTVSFFAGILPLFGFIAAIIIGGEIGANISNFLYKDFYPWVIVLGSLAILVGLVAMYVGKIEGLSVKNAAAKAPDEGEEKTQSAEESQEQSTDSSDQAEEK